MFGGFEVASGGIDAGVWDSEGEVPECRSAQSDFERFLGKTQLRHFHQSRVKHMVEVAPLIAKIRSGQPADALESIVLDFKSGNGQFKDVANDLAEACVCFANAAGGTIVLGVRDRPGGEDALLGTDLKIDALRSAIYDKTQPALNVTITEHVVGGKR